jgi:hypothetical protein
VDRERYEFHDVNLSTRVRFAYHALAIDEHREPFEPTLWKKQPNAPKEQELEQAWFPGVHCDVGGGYSERGLSDGALTWMSDRAARAGLAIDLTRIPKGDPTAPMHDSESLLFKLFGEGRRKLGATNPIGCEDVHRSAVERKQSDPSYGRGALQAFLSLQPPPKVSKP